MNSSLETQEAVSGEKKKDELGVAIHTALAG